MGLIHQFAVSALQSMQTTTTLQTRQHESETQRPSFEGLKLRYFLDPENTVKLSGVWHFNDLDLPFHLGEWQGYEQMYTKSD